MGTYWREVAHGLDQDRAGACGFRLMPTDELHRGPATARLTTAAAGCALVLTYSWTHPADGGQEGVLLVSSPDPAAPAPLQATWIDSWHQKPGPLLLTGELTGGTIRLTGTYFETWGWEIDLDISTNDALGLVMRNVVPPDAGEHAPAGSTSGPYVVMDLSAR